MKRPTEITLRIWTKKDFPIVREILLVTWKDTYAFIPEKDILTHFENYYSEKKLNELYNNANVKGIMAEYENRSIGWMKLFDDYINKRYYISSLYVLPEFQGYGAGKKLFLKGEEFASKLKYDRIWLGVMKDNIKALNWYKNIGFDFIEEEPFKMGGTEVMHLIGYKILNQIE